MKRNFWTDGGCSHAALRTICCAYTATRPSGDSYALSVMGSMLVQLVPKGRKWTSGFTNCGGGYLASNRIGLMGLTRFKQLHPALPLMPSRELGTAVNMSFQRSEDTVSNILACDQHGKLLTTRPPAVANALNSFK